ncbi:hypothetical protein OSTOST_24750, partial [Ostertagia ostertagi]
MQTFLLITAIISAVSAFQCSRHHHENCDSTKRMKQLDKDCKMVSNNEPECANKNEVESAWKEFTKLSDRYKERLAVAICSAANDDIIVHRTVLYHQ